MTAKRLMVLIVAAVFTLGISSVGIAAQEIEGTVSRIEGDLIVVLDDLGEELTVHVKDKVQLAKLQKGDRVKVKGGKVTKVGG